MYNVHVSMCYVENSVITPNYNEDMVAGQVDLRTTYPGGGSRVAGVEGGRQVWFGSSGPPTAAQLQLQLNTPPAWPAG